MHNFTFLNSILSDLYFTNNVFKTRVKLSYHVSYTSLSEICIKNFGTNIDRLKFRFNVIM